jgi:hypothetical protein
VVMPRRDDSTTDDMPDAPASVLKA